MEKFVCASPYVSNAANFTVESVADETIKGHRQKRSTNDAQEVNRKEINGPTAPRV